MEVHLQVLRENSMQITTALCVLNYSVILQKCLSIIKVKRLFPTVCQRSGY